MAQKTGSRTPVKLGYETIYPEQQDLAHKVMARLIENECSSAAHKRIPVAMLPPQGGKTGAIQHHISLFIDFCVAKQYTFQIIVMCGLPHLDLLEQTRGRLTEGVVNGDTLIGAQLDMKARNSGLLRLPAEHQSKGILVLHNSTKLRRLDLNVPVDRRLWITDEVHLGNIKGGNIDIVLKKHGVRVCEQIHTWDNRRTVNHFVGVSATPSAHMILDDRLIPGLLGEGLTDVIYIPLPPSYNSMALMMAKGRLKQTAPLFLKDGTVTEMWRVVVTEFAQNCRRQGPGHLVVRATGKKHTMLLNHLNRRGRKVEYREFDSESGNIDELNDYLSTQPSEPMIVVIRGSMRAGITLGHNHFIRGWVETESGTADTQAQSGVGRACGYGRTHETYPIYCDLRHVNSWIKAYEELDTKNRVESVPSGIQNRSVRPGRGVGYPFLKVMPHKQAWDMYVKPFRDNDKNRAGKIQYRTQLATTRQVSVDVAGMYLDGERRDSGSTEGIHVEGPTRDSDVVAYLKKHPEADPKEVREWARRNRESYKRLLQKYPEATPKGEKTMVIVFNTHLKRKHGLAPEIDGPISSHTRSELQRSRSATKK